MTDKHENEVLERYSFTLPPRLINTIDETRAVLGISRSMSVREALKHWVDHAVTEENLSGQGIAVINYVFDHHESRVVEDLSKAKHHTEVSILSINHMHISHQVCVEVITCRGELKVLRQFVNRIKSIKGIRAIKNTYTQILRLNDKK